MGFLFLVGWMAFALVKERQRPSHQFAVEPRVGFPNLIHEVSVGLQANDRLEVILPRNVLSLETLIDLHFHRATLLQRSPASFPLSPAGCWADRPEQPRPGLHGPELDLDVSD
jgi:hypothetical protein